MKNIDLRNIREYYGDFVGINFLFEKFGGIKDVIFRVGRNGIRIYYYENHFSIYYILEENGWIDDNRKCRIKIKP